MSSIWSTGATQAGAFPFATTGLAPSPGGGGAAKFQSVLQAAGKPGQASGQAGSGPVATPVAAGPITSSTGATASDSSSTGSSAVVSANDFLTLLVTEMQNQDPTSQTDPNAYINQLVQINSLEQLISINQNLSAVLGAATTTPGSAPGTTGNAATGSAKADAVAAAANLKPAATGLQSHRTAASTVQAAGAANRPGTVRGTQSVPGDAPAAHAVGRALDGRVRGTGSGHAIRDIPVRSLP